MSTRDVWLRALEQAIVEGRHHKTVLMMHDELLAQLHNSKNPPPDWDRFPVGRDYFTQYDPKERHA